MTIRVASSSASNSPTAVAVSSPPPYYRAQEFEVFNLLQHPIWVFDVEHPRMLWANTQALRVWNAPDLESLLARDFTDVSSATQVRMKELWEQLQLQKVIQEEWTFYPKGRATTLSMTLSAIAIDADGRVGCLAEAELPNKDAFLESTVRGIELLRHLPFAVAQFSMEGSLLFQNPESIRLFGTNDICFLSSSSSSCSNGKKNNSSSGTRSNPIKSSPSPEQEQTPMDEEESVDFLRHFVDPEYGIMALHQVQEGHDFHGEAQYHTLQGKKWFAVTLRRTRDPVTSHFVILHSVRDISDIIQARQETTRAKQFLAVMAHEIRTPLHQIIGSVDLLEEDVQKLYEGELLNSVQQIKSSSSLLMSIINDLLDYSKLEVGQMQMENVTFALDGVMDGCLACVKPEAERKSLLLSSSTDATSQRVHLIGDPNRLRQIILNLLSNAVKFTDHGSVQLAVSALKKTADMQKLRFAVTDTGIGIDAAEQGAVFEKYRQANASVARHFGGTGLGLAICKGLVELLGGTIGLDSKLGRGTTVSFEITFRIPNHMSNSATPGSVDLASSSSLTKNTAPSWHVLIVEDNTVNQKVLQAMLRRLGHVTTTAEHGEVALEEMQRNRFDLILMDVQMPVMDGIACTQHIRTKLGFDKHQVRIIGLTAGFLNSEKEYYENEVGMNCCLGKPIRMEALKQAIARQQQEESEMAGTLQ
jgi:signal transduction histidine kinase/ActR/RegA family two-component response regulator